MRTEADIRAKMKFIGRKLKSHRSHQGYELDKWAISVLGWALGLDLKERYFCGTCKKSHPLLRCPWCGGENDILENSDGA
ncbi:hypothetical protein LCGC14_0369630 [marine sediment metagenome]|uniref:Uncharacterized protein n=1 Tax=marine sediment metagenome TaxID=412755 RepID=A0A0F9TBA9_9ZZZZ